MSEQPDAWEWGGPRRNRPRLTPSGADILTPLQMKQMVDTLAGIMRSTSMRLLLRVEDYLAYGDGDPAEAERLIRVAESLPKLAARMVDFVYGTNPLEPPKDHEPDTD